MKALRAPVRRTARHHARAAGFTLLEALAATAVVALLGGVMLTFGLQAQRSGARAETERRLLLLREAVVEHLRSQATDIAARPDATLWLARETGGDRVLPNAGALDVAALASLAAHLPAATGDLARDGHGTPFRLLVTPPLAGAVDGSPVAYRRLVIVSAGPNQRFDSTAWDAATGVLTLAGDDRAAVVDGLALLRPQVQETRRRLQRLGQLVAAYAGARFAASPARDAGIDTFAGAPAGATESPWDDVDNALARRSTKPQPGLTDAELAALGADPADGRDAWGGPIDFDNDGDAVRHPDHPLPALRAPPFTARLVATLPGGGALVETVIATP